MSNATATLKRAEPTRPSVANAGQQDKADRNAFAQRETAS